MRRAAVLIALLSVALAVAYAGWSFSRRTRSDMCMVCLRSTHAHSRVVGTAGGHRVVFCCLACALSQRRQAGTHIQLTSVPDYSGGGTVQLDRGYVVAGSDVIPCSQHQPHIDQNKQPVALEFDRCAPSILPFASRDEAAIFARNHGGRVVPLNEFEAALSR